MTEIPRPQPLYLAGQSPPVFGFLHAVARGSEPDVAVLMCPPFGWDEVCSYRSRREWAIHLAGAGYPALRFDLPSTGDSAGSPQDPGRLEAWVDAAAAAAAWLREETGVAQVAAIGIGLGGLVISVALARGAPIDDLVLWATPARGRSLMRELRAFASLEAKGLSPNRASRGSLQRADRSSAPAGRELEVGGFVLTRETVQALETLDVCELAIPEPSGRNVLLLQRDGLPVDARLRNHFEAAGVEVSVADTRGYGSMIARPQDAVAPTDAFAAVDHWLDRLPRDRETRRATRSSQAVSAAAVPEAEIMVDGVAVRETPFFVDGPALELFGILTQPADETTADLCVVLFNAGAIHRIGPNRMWVEMARRWAARGVPVARVDLATLGDSGGDPLASRDLAALYSMETIHDVRAILDALTSRGVATQFVLGGLCSGAYWAFHGALQDDRVVSALLLNPRAFFWDPALDKMRELRASLHSGQPWRRAAHGDVSMNQILELLQWAPKAPVTLMRRAVGRRRSRSRGEDQLDQALDALRESGETLLVAFSGDEPLYDELAREGRLERMATWPNITLQKLPGADHSLRGLDAQRAAHAVMDSALRSAVKSAKDMALRSPRQEADPREAAAKLR